MPHQRRRKRRGAARLERAAPICGCAGLVRTTVPAVWPLVNVMFCTNGGGSGTDGV